MPAARPVIPCSSWWSCTTASNASCAIGGRGQYRRRSQQAAAPQRFELYDSVPIGSAAPCPADARQPVRLVPAACGAGPRAGPPPRSHLVTRSRLWGTWALSLRHRLQRGRRHLPHLLSLDAGAALRRPGRRSAPCSSGAAARAGWRPALPPSRCGRPMCWRAGALGWQTPWMAAPIAALLAAAVTLWRDKRPPALGGRRGPAGAAVRLGAQPDLRRRQSHPAVGQPAALARHQRRPRADPVAQLGRAERRPQACRVPARPSRAGALPC